MSSHLLKRAADTRGQSLVEFSFVAFLSVMLILGAFEMCRMVLVYTTIANAARAGARYAIVNGSDVSASTSALTTQVQTTVKGYLSTASVNIGSANLSIPVGYPDTTMIPGNRVTVTVSYLYDPFVGYFPFSGIHLSSTTEGVFTY